jgi:hypothetical protein
MKKLFIIGIMAILPSLFISSCKKDEPEPEVPTYRQPSIATRTQIVEIPAGLQNSQDPNAQMGAAWMGIANGLAAFGSSFAVPTDAQIQNTKSTATVYYWTYGGYSYWMTYSETADKYVWKYDYEWPGYPRFTFIEANELKNGTAGQWMVYNPEGAHEVLWKYDWTLNAANDYAATILFYGQQEYENIKFDVLARGNNSGYFKLFEGAQLLVEIIWNANGSGTWWIYGYGEENYTGSWTN